MTTILQSHILSSTAGTDGRSSEGEPSGEEMARPDSRLAISVTEAAELLGISRALAYELVARGELPSVRLGRRLVVPRVALVAMCGTSGPDAA